MVGIYIHIPFCKQACSYCNFHFSTSGKNRKELIDAICSEITERALFLKDQSIQSLYFGGGTPSVLTKEEIHKIFNSLHRSFDLNSLQECTLEASTDRIVRSLRLFRHQKSYEDSYGFNKLSFAKEESVREILIEPDRFYGFQVYQAIRFHTTQEFFIRYLKLSQE